GRVIIKTRRLRAAVQAEKLVDLGRRLRSRKVNCPELAADVQEAVAGPRGIDVKADGAEKVVDADHLGLDRTRKVLRCEGVRQIEREAHVGVSGQSTPMVPGNSTGVVNAQQLGENVGLKVHRRERIADGVRCQVSRCAPKWNTSHRLFFQRRTSQGYLKSLS